MSEVQKRQELIDMACSDLQQQNAEQAAELDRLRIERDGYHNSLGDAVNAEAYKIAQIDKLVRAIYGMEQIEDGEDFEGCGHDVDDAIAKAGELRAMLLTEGESKSYVEMLMAATTARNCWGPPHGPPDNTKAAYKAIIAKLDQQAATKATDQATLQKSLEDIREGRTQDVADVISDYVTDEEDAADAGDGIDEDVSQATTNFQRWQDWKRLADLDDGRAHWELRDNLDRVRGEVWGGTWHTYDGDSVGGENDLAAHSLDARCDVHESLIRQGWAGFSTTEATDDTEGK